MHCITSLLIKTSEALGTLLIFLSNLQITSEWECASLNAAIIIFRLLYSLNIPHSNQIHHFLLLWTLSIHLFRIHILTTFHHIVRCDRSHTKIMLKLALCDFTIVTGDVNRNCRVCLSFLGSQPKFNWVSQVY